MEGKSWRANLATKAVGILAAVATLVTGGVISAATTAQTASASTVLTTSRDATLGNASFEAAREQYGLTEEMKDGNTLHAWMWSFNTIKNNMADIAAAGYTSIQTEPVLKCKQNTANGMKFADNWWYVYQPINNDSIGNFVVGSEDDFKAMTAEAHKYGVRIIVDVVANHMTSDWGAIESGRWKDKSLYRGGGDSYKIQNDEWGDRYKVTHKALLGLWEINSNDTRPGEYMQETLRKLVADGADGFRYDAAKHIELPGEFSSDSNGSPYWTQILDNGAQYQYGEVLQDSISRDADYAALFNKYSSDGGGVTASGYGYTVRTAITSGTMRASDLQSYADPADPDNVVLWVESHDNYSNEDKLSVSITDDQLKLGWAIVGSRAEGMALFFDRPAGSGGSNAQFTEQTKLGDKGSDLYKSAEVAAVNHFKNQMDGNVEYLHNCGTNADNSKCLMIDRYLNDGNSQNDGTVVVNSSGDYSLSGTTVKLDDGTYTDEVHSGNTITVKGGKITSGTAKNGVNVFYNRGGSVSKHGSVSASPTDSSFKTDTYTINLYAKNAKDLKYTTSEGDSGTFANGDKIIIGGSTDAGDTITVTLTGTDTTEDNAGQPLKATYTYTKLEKGSQQLSSHYSTNAAGFGKKKTITIDGDLSDWDSSMKIAQGAANDDPRVYRENSMWEVPIDLYALYGAYDDNNLYLMWEYTNVQDAVDPGDDYPLSQGVLYKSQNLAQWIAVNTGNSDKIGNGAGLKTGGTLWDNGITYTQDTNRIIEMSTNGSNGPWVYSGDSTGLDSNAMYGPGANATTNTKKSGITMKYGLGILESSVIGIDGGWGTTGNPARKVGDVSSDSSNWVDFNTKGHNSSTMDFHYEIAIPLSELGMDAGSVATNGVSVQVIGTMGLSGMDSLPYDLAENDNADQPDTKSQALNSYEKSDKDEMSAAYACIGSCPNTVHVDPETVTISGSDVSSGTVSRDISSGDVTTQLKAKVGPTGASQSVTWSSSDESVATVDSKGLVTMLKAGTATITAKTPNGKSASVTVTVTGKITPVDSITVSPSSLDLMKGDTSQLTATINPTNATAKTVTWSSSDDTIASVDSTGKVTAKKAGSATITASAGGKSASVTVTVTKSTNDVIYVTKPSGWSTVYAYMYTGSGTSAASNAKWPGVALTQMTADDNCAKSGTYMYEVPDGLASGAKVIFSDNGSGTNRYPADMVPGMDYNGGPVSWTSGATSLSDVTCTAPTVPVTGVTISKTSLELTEGQNGTLTASVTPSNATDKTITWSSSDDSVATVNGGIVTAVKAGTATITATSSNGKSATCTLTVKAKTPERIDVTGVTISKDSLELVEGQNGTLTASVTPSNATDKTITWESSDPSVATVNNGVVTAVKAGTATITAKSSNGKTATCTVTVTPVSAEPTAVTVTPETNNVTVGSATQLTATLTPSNATTTLTWTSSDPSVIRVDSNGLVAAVGKGKAQVIVKTANDKYAFVKFNVSAAQQNVAVESVTLPSETNTMYTGDTLQLSATVLPQNATDKSLTWKSYDENIVSVDQNGLLTAKAKGQTVVTVTSNSDQTKYAFTKVTVADKSSTTVDPTGVTLDRSSLDLTVGGAATLTATVAPSNATNKAVTWKSNNPSVAVVGQNGTVTALKGGTALITVTTANNLSATCYVSVKDAAVPVTGVTVAPENASVTAGQTVQLTATVTPANATDKTVTWKSSNPSVATVDANGKVTGLAEGLVVITATTSNGKTDSVAVHVNAATIPVQQIAVNPSQLTLTVGEKQQVTATVYPANATDQTLKWVSSNSTVASVGQDGTITALSAGDATITVYNIASGTIASVPVTVNPTQGIKMERLYNPNSGEHLFSSDQNEIGVLTKIGWTDEGYAWTAPTTGTPVHRLYNPNTGEHHYTLDNAEFEGLKKIGWTDEGIGWYSAPGSTGIPVYRVYNPNASQFSHHYSSSRGEIDNLRKAGWTDEGIGWYGLA